MNNFTAYPPIHLHASKRLSPSEARELLSEFLNTATTDPSLHPNCLLTEAGPVAQSAGPNTGLVLLNLKRVLAGLEGEHLAADLTSNKDIDGEGMSGLMSYQDVDAGEEASRRTTNIANLDGSQEWQDKGEYEREQSVTQGEIGIRHDNIGAEMDSAVGRTGYEPRKAPKVANPQEKEERRLKKKKHRAKRTG
ncbi:MAG: hypothetical protein Q9214_007399 [Letrouitia sp. 1 TL-2023]